MSFACRLGRNTVTGQAMRVGASASASRRALHAAATANAQGSTSPGPRLRPQNAPRLRPQNAPKATPQTSAAATPSPAPTTPLTPPTSAPQTAPRLAPKEEKYKRTPLTPEERAKQFAARLEYVGDRIGLEPKVKDAIQIRNTAWNQLLDLADSREDVEKVVELMPHWTAMKREFRPETVKWFIERTYSLSCPDLAFRVFADPLKYGIRVPSLTAGTELIASAVRRTSPAPDASTLSQITALVGVMNVQGHPAFASALVPCTVLLRAMVDPRMKNKASERVARTLLPQLRELITKRDPLPEGALASASPVRRWALESGLLGVQKWMPTAGEHDSKWLWDFREKSGLLAEGETPDKRMGKVESSLPNVVPLMRTVAEEKGMRVSV